VTENGYGKRSALDEYRLTGRGGKGVITVRNTKRNGPTVSVKGVRDTDELMIITKNGLVIRMQVEGISMMGRDTQGVKLINLEPGDKVVGVGRVISPVEHEEVEAAAVGEPPKPVAGGPEAQEVEDMAERDDEFEDEEEEDDKDREDEDYEEEDDEDDEEGDDSEEDNDDTYDT
jgi:DNA gyrase subunit A